MSERREQGKKVPIGQAYRWRDKVRWLFAHSNGEEFLLVAFEDERHSSSGWTGQDAAEKLKQMGWVEADDPLPAILHEHVAERLRQRRERPSALMQRLMVPMP